MNLIHIVSGILLFVIFWAFSAGYLNFLGSYIWIAAVVVFIVLMMVMGKVGRKAKPPEDVGNAWTFGIIFALVVTVMMTFAAPYMGATATPDQIGNYMLAFWLVVFGGAMFVTGWGMKMGSATMVGLIWLFSSVYFITGTGTASAGLMWFAILTGIPFIILGAMMKK